jgi:hypothetical protein
MPSASGPKSILVCVVAIADAMRAPDSEVLLGETGIRAMAADVKISARRRDIRSDFMGILRNERMITRAPCPAATAFTENINEVLTVLR